LDYIMWVYEQRNTRSPIGFRDWIATEYDHERISDEFAKVPFWKRLRL